MAERITHLFSCPDIINRLASAAGAALVSWRQDGVAAALRDVATKLTEIVNVEDFASAGDPDDTLRLQRAAAAIVARGGGTLWFKHGKAYTVLTGAPASQVVICNVTGTKGVTIEGNGATITSARVNSSYGDVLFYAQPAENLTVRNLKFIGGFTGAFATGPTDAQYFIAFGGGCKNIRAENVTVTKCGYGVACLNESAINTGVYV